MNVLIQNSIPFGKLENYTCIEGVWYQKGQTMDEIIKSYDSVPFGELSYCYKKGIMYQSDMTKSVAYDNHYFEDYVRKENSEIAKKLNAARTSITQKHCTSVLDIGVGSGEFIKSSNIPVFGYDINQVAVRWLRQQNIYRDPYKEMPEVDGLTFWDSIEHIPNPGALLSLIEPSCFVFISVPIFSDLLRVRESKHFKMNEHYFYFTADGLITYMKDSGFNIIEISDEETKAGRESILSFVFKKF